MLKEITGSFIRSGTVISLIRTWLTIILLFLPFQYFITRNLSQWNDLATDILKKLDEITIIVILPLAIMILFRKREIYKFKYAVLLCSFSVFCVSGVVSGLIAGNPVFLTMHGTFDYIKYFFVIIIYGAFFREFNEFKKIFRLLLIVAVFLGTIAFIQEFWAVVYRYILEKDITDKSMYIFREVKQGSWRFGIYRATSLIGQYNIFGLYSLLILFMYLSIAKKVNFAVFIALFTGIMVSVSRMIYTAALLLAGLNIFRRKWIIYLLLTPIVIIFFLMTSLPDLNLSHFMEDQVTNSSEIYASQSKPSLGQYRISAREKGLEIWKDYPLLGVGPGMFGSDIAAKYRSPVYEEYNFHTSLNWFDTLDQFWPQVLAETGVVGTGAFAGLLLTLFIIYAHSIREANTKEMRSLFKGLILCTIAVIIFSFGGILNHPVILFTYAALAGMGLGCEIGNPSDTNQA